MGKSTRRSKKDVVYVRLKFTNYYILSIRVSIYETNRFFSNVDLRLKPPCKNGDPCHERAPRGSRTGLQGVKGAEARSMYPPKLCEHMVDVCESYLCV